MTTIKSCGGCDTCCKVLAIETQEKPAGPLCDHCTRGCSNNEGRPDACRGFHALWQKSEGLAPGSRLDPEWRPDRAKFVMYAERADRRLNVIVDAAHPVAWKRELYSSFIKRLLRRTEGYELLV